MGAHWWPACHWACRLLLAIAVYFVKFPLSRLPRHLLEAWAHRCWGRSGHSETGARCVRGGSEGSSWPLFNRPRVTYTPAVVVWRRWEDGGEVEEQGEDLGALCRCTQQVQRLVSVWRKSREAPRSCWHGKLRPGRSRKQKSSRSDLELRPRAATTIIKR